MTSFLYLNLKLNDSCVSSNSFSILEIFKVFLLDDLGGTNSVTTISIPEVDDYGFFAILNDEVLDEQTQKSSRG